jgi:hypothetical protein
MGRVKAWYQEIVEREQENCDDDYHMEIMYNQQTGYEPVNVVGIQQYPVDNKSFMGYNTYIETEIGNTND